MTTSRWTSPPATSSITPTARYAAKASIEKLAIFQLWRNYIKRRREKGPRATPAMVVGVANRPWQLRDLLKERVFFHKTVLSPCWQRYYCRDVHTRPLRVNRTHALRYAF